jgi:hypothetical protein
MIGQSDTLLTEWKASHLAFALTCGTAIEQPTIGTLSPVPQAPRVG